MVSRSERLSRQDSTLELWIFTILGATLQIFLSLPQVYNNVIQLRNVGFSLPLIPDSTGLIVPLIIPLVYTLFWSQRFHRLMSAINVQLQALAIGTVLIVNDLITGSGPPPVFERVSIFIAIAAFAIQWFFSASVFLVFGVSQTFLVKWAIGLNLEEDMDVVAYSINADPETVAKIVFDEGFEHTWHFRRKMAKNETTKLLTRRDPYGTERLVLALGQDPEVKANSIVALVAFDIRFYDLQKSDEASSILASVIRDFKGKLVENNPSVNMTLLSGSSKNPVTSEAYDYAIRPTRSKLDIASDAWHKFPKYHKYLFTALSVGLVAAISSLVIAVSVPINNFPYDTVITLGSLLFLAIVIDLGQSLRTELAQKKEQSR